MILCMNLNAAIDKTVIVPSFQLDAIHRPEQVTALAGGKGCNVARALKRLGADPVVSGWVGGTAGQFIEQGLNREGIQTAFIYTEFESRTCLSILDPAGGTLTELYENGDPVPPDKIETMLDWFRQSVAAYDAVTLSGSLPPGVPSDFYAQLITLAHEVDVPVLLDTSKDALASGIEARPFLVKPNQHEFASLAGEAEIQTTDAIIKVARAVASRYGTRIVVSLGPEGAIAADETQVLWVHNPQVNAKSAVGSGDCTLAGLTYGFVKGFSFQEALMTGVAAGTANTLTVGAGQFTLDDFERVRAHTTVEAV